MVPSGWTVATVPGGAGLVVHCRFESGVFGLHGWLWFLVQDPMSDGFRYWADIRLPFNVLGQKHWTIL